jgi:hypothetical protein
MNNEATNITSNAKSVAMPNASIALLLPAPQSVS